MSVYWHIAQAKSGPGYIYICTMLYILESGIDFGILFYLFRAPHFTFTDFINAVLFHEVYGSHVI